MLYLVMDTRSPGSIQRLFAEQMLNTCTQANIDFTAVMLESSIGPNSTADDTWLFCDPFHPLVYNLKSKAGKKYAFYHCDDHCETFLPMHDFLNCCDKIFVPSVWMDHRLRAAIGESNTQTAVCGIPFDVEPYLPFQKTVKDSKLVAFNQPFSLQCLHILKVHLAEILANEGYQVVQLCSPQEMITLTSDRESRVLYHQGRKRGLHFIITENDHQRLTKVAMAQLVIDLSATKSLSHRSLEAAAVNTVSIAPNHGEHSEIYQPQNLYSPYNVESIIRLVINPPGAGIDLAEMLPGKVCNFCLNHMEAI